MSEKKSITFVKDVTWNGVAYESGATLSVTPEAFAKLIRIGFGVPASVASAISSAEEELSRVKSEIESPVAPEATPESTSQTATPPAASKTKN